jgi:hypothetical protein
MAFWGVFAAGFVACSALGIGPVLKQMGGQWLSMPMLAGMTLGVAILALAVAFALGYRPALLPSDQAMLVALTVLIAVKVGIGALAMTVMRAG